MRNVLCGLAALLISAAGCTVAVNARHDLDPLAYSYQPVQPEDSRHEHRTEAYLWEALIAPPTGQPEREYKGYELRENLRFRLESSQEEHHQSFYQPKNYDSSVFPLITVRFWGYQHK